QLKEKPEGSVVFPLGPFYPTLEEPAYFRLFLEGERIVDCDYRGFYNHKGIEKLGDSALNYNQIPFLAERICGICGTAHSTAYCQAVEMVAEIEVPLRARYIRSIMGEFERIHSHLLWLGIAGHVVGFDTILMQVWRIREPIMWLSEKVTGNRKTYGMNIVGGVRRDIPKEMHSEILEIVDKLDKETRAVLDAISTDTPLLMRLENVGVLKNADAVKYAALGPTARGSGVAIDARIDHPYAAYDLVEFEKVVETGEDVLARTLVRIKEVFQAVSIIRQCIKSMPEGPLVAKIDKPIPPGKIGLSSTEAQRGEAHHYVITGEDNQPIRWKARAPTYQNLQAIPSIIFNETIADVPLDIASIDPCFSCTERMETVDVKTGEVKIYTKKELEKISRDRYKHK
ncbi:nickel-dependent hydrogenase large subunit, partial [bacterium]|nr:nickel-dependent hydrogenase large subunit [bacterium]